MKEVVLITGASAGIGKETARLLKEAGYIVYGVARRIEKMKELEQYGVNILQMDVTDDISMQNVVQHIIEKEGHLDVLINNAGYGSYGAVEDVPLSEAKYQFDVNLFGLARLTQLVLPYMRKNKKGKIINISSIAGKISEPHGAWYHATKFALEGFSDCLRQELKQFGIKVVIIQPGTIFSEWNSIARKNMRKISGNTVYKNLVEKHIKFFESADSSSSLPIVVAKTILKSVKATNPKTRYAVGKNSMVSLLLRKILPDKLYDTIFLSIIKNVKI